MKRFRNILYLAGQAVEQPSLERAIRLAEANGARLTLMGVAPRAEMAEEVRRRFAIDLDDVLEQQTEMLLADLLRPYRDRALEPQTRVARGSAFLEAIRAVQAGEYDLLIKTAEPPQGLAESLFGSGDMHLLRKCPCPVWIDRPRGATPYRRVLAAVDPGEASEGEGPGCGRLILDLATSLAEREGARLEVVHVWRLPGEEALRRGLGRIPESDLAHLLGATEAAHRERLDALLAPYGLDSSDPWVHLVKGEPAERIGALAERSASDLIVMGTLGRVGLPGLIMGNTAESVLQRTRASVLAVKPEGFVSPVGPA